MIPVNIDAYAEYAPIDGSDSDVEWIYLPVVAIAPSDDSRMGSALVLQPNGIVAPIRAYGVESHKFVQIVFNMET